MDAIHHGILSWKAGYDIIARDTEEWTSVFANLAAKSNSAEEVKSFCFPSTGEPYVCGLPILLRSTLSGGQDVTASFNQMIATRPLQSLALCRMFFRMQFTLTAV